MSAANDFISAESENIHNTIEMIKELLGKETLSKYETIALGKLLQDIYSGVERILRTLLENKGVATKKTESWHKELLITAKKHSMISQAEFDAFRNLLLFRHMQIHSYGFMLDEKRLRQLAEPIPNLCHEFLKKIV
jgi:uncharacterized protein YutE (UPF0331/DUF86 family)